MSTDIGLARKQRVFAIAEDTAGNLKFPATTDYILPAGNAVMNQNPEFVDSEELIDSLDVIDRFQNATPPGTFSLPTYVRPSGTLLSVPQGDILFQSMMGLKNPATTASLSAALSTTGTSLEYDGVLGGVLPERGIVQIESEKLYYTTKTDSASSGTLGGLTRAYDSTTAVEHADNTLITLKSLLYRQATTSPSFSLWIETDHFTQGLSGCTVNNAVLGITNEGASTLTFNGEGMKMVWAGTDALTANAGAGATLITITNAKRYKSGSYIQNSTQSHNNSGSGYRVIRTDNTLNKIALGTVTEGSWATSDVIKGYLPTGTKIGSPIESKDTAIELDSVDAKFKTTDLTFNVPKNYLTDEVGTEYPEEYVEDKRSIESTLNLYFKKADAKYFSDGYTGNEIPIEIVLGDTIGSKMAIYMKKAKLEVPAITFSTPTVELNIPLRALGTLGEDSCEVRFE